MKLLGTGCELVHFSSLRCPFGLGPDSDQGRRSSELSESFVIVMTQVSAIWCSHLSRQQLPSKVLNFLIGDDPDLGFAREDETNHSIKLVT